MSRARWGDEVTVDCPGRPSVALVRLVRRYLAPVVDACHRPTLAGVEHLPASGPFLLVANHSAGLGVAEIMSILVLYLRHVGEHRPLAAFTHPLGHRVYPMTVALRHLGAVPSTYAAAAATLAAGIPLLVFPGGDHETLRPIWQYDRVDFGGRLGFLRIAREAGVPVVPLGIRGGHLTAPILFRSRALATLLVAPRLIGQKRWGVSLLGALVGAALLAAGPGPWWLRAALALLFAGSPLSFLPWIPWTLRLRIGAPIAAADLFPARDGTDDELRRALGRVEAALQSLVDR